MQNNDLKSLVTQIHENLIDFIDQQEHTSKEQVINYLKNAVITVENIDDAQLDSIDNAKAAYANTYKEIAEDSISSYKSTNVRFEKLTQIHEETINQCQDSHIDLDLLTEKFNEIQSHMSDEVLKANQIISELSDKVKVLEETSNIDALTKVYNRRALIKYLSNMCDNKANYELHFLMLDVDDFKKVNDTYGHLAGDKILIYIANILKKTLRDGDKIFRYGGEEFVIILNRIDNAQCLSITTRLLELIRANKLIYKGHDIKVTISIGATKYVQSDTPDSLLARADKALYIAKNSGKNKMHSEV